MTSEHTPEMLELVAIDALGSLQPDEAASVREHTANCPQCRAEYANARAATTALALSVREEPPARLRATILSAAARPATKVTTIPAGRRAIGFALAAAAVVAVLVAGQHFFVGEHARTERSWIAACAPPRAGCTISGRVVAAAADSMILETHGLRTLPSEKAYQAWVIRPGAKPTPEPVFTVDPQGNGLVRIPVSAAKGIVVAVTIEPRSGSRAPTTKPILAAKLD
ncbi:MAG: anti-sigma factor [Candidatus Eremiobacteraeota bacterium]|nr:anti-sigma factor [Candidatus Eremiobacteraeota bacterium]MBC5827371.1 anti-sigma factor [Candidatus Eremiobacteraeota bacterium]